MSHYANSNYAFVKWTVQRHAEPNLFAVIETHIPHDRNGESEYESELYSYEQLLTEMEERILELLHFKPRELSFRHHFVPADTWTEDPYYLRLFEGEHLPSYTKNPLVTVRWRLVEHPNNAHSFTLIPVFSPSPDSPNYMLAKGPK